MSDLSMPCARSPASELTDPWLESSGASAWQPPVEPLVWFDATHAASIFGDVLGESGVTIGGTIARVNNRGTAGIHLLASTADHRPVWDLTSDLYSYQFLGTDDRLISNTTLDLTGASVFTLIFARTRTTDTPLAAVVNHNSTTAPYFQVRDPAGSPSTNCNLLSRSADSTDTTQVVISSPATNTSVITVEMRLDTRVARMRINRGSWSQDDYTGVGTAFANGLFSIGCASNATLFFTGKVYQVFGISSLLTTEQIEAFEDRCAELSGVTF